MHEDRLAPDSAPADPKLPPSLLAHRVSTTHPDDVLHGSVHWEPRRSLWFTGMALGALVGGPLFFSWSALLLFLVSTGTVLLLGHSLGMHRKLIHDSYQCPKWLEYLLVWCGTQVGLAGPLSLLRTHELRDYAQRLPRCHDFLAHRQPPLKDAWWQLHCELKLERPPMIAVGSAIADDRFYRGLEATWKLQHLLIAVLLWAWGGWGFVFWGLCARVTAGVLGHWLIGWFAHNRGEQSHLVNGASVQGHNVRWTSLLTMGECWHNSHHAWPGSARLGVLPGQWDPGWWMLKLLERIGLAWQLRLPADLPVRAELQELPAVMRPPGVPSDLIQTSHTPLRDLRTATGQRSRAMALVELLLQITHAMVLTILVFTIATAAVVLAASWLAALARGDLLGIVDGVVSSLWVVLLGAALGATVWMVLLPYAMLAALVLIKLSLNGRVVMMLAFALPAVLWQQVSDGRHDAVMAGLVAAGMFHGLVAHHLVLRLALPLRQQPGPQVTVLYDGSSSLCAAYARRLHDHFLGGLQIVDARRDAAMRASLQETGLNPERGLIMLTADGTLQGARALRWLARRTAPGLRWLLADLLLASPLAFVLYPLFRGVRALQLRRAGLPRLDRIGALA